MIGNFRGLQNDAHLSCPVIMEYCLALGAVSIALDRTRDAVHRLQIKCESAILSERTGTEVAGSSLTSKAIASNVVVVCARTNPAILENSSTAEYSMSLLDQHSSTEKIDQKNLERNMEESYSGDNGRHS